MKFSGEKLPFLPLSHPYPVSLSSHVCPAEKLRVHELLPNQVPVSTVRVAQGGKQQDNNKDAQRPSFRVLVLLAMARDSKKETFEVGETSILCRGTGSQEERNTP